MCVRKLLYKYGQKPETPSKAKIRTLTSLKRLYFCNENTCEAEVSSDLWENEQGFRSYATLALIVDNRYAIQVFMWSRDSKNRQKIVTLLLYKLC